MQGTGGRRWGIGRAGRPAQCLCCRRCGTPTAAQFHLLFPTAAPRSALLCPASSPTPIPHTTTCVQHYVGNDLEGWTAPNGRFFSRKNFDATITAADMRDSYTVPFQACADAHANAIMCSYNAVNGLPSCGNSATLTGVLRGSLKFKGMVVTDCTGAVGLLQCATLQEAGRGRPHRCNAAVDCTHYPSTLLPRPCSTPAPSIIAVQSASIKPPVGLGFGGGHSSTTSALFIKAGTDMYCHDSKFLHPSDLAPATLDRAAGNVLAARVRLGHLDPKARRPYPSLDAGVMGLPSHAASAREMAARSIVLLKNTGVGVE